MEGIVSVAGGADERRTLVLGPIQRREHDLADANGMRAFIRRVILMRVLCPDRSPCPGRIPAPLEGTCARRRGRTGRRFSSCRRCPSSQCQDSTGGGWSSRGQWRSRKVRRPLLGLGDLRTCMVPRARTEGRGLRHPRSRCRRGPAGSHHMDPRRRSGFRCRVRSPCRLH